MHGTILAQLKAQKTSAVWLGHLNMQPRLWASLVVALFAFSMPRILFHDSGIAMWVSFTLAGCWTVLFIGGLYKFKRRGLWLLIGAPFALFWPVALFLALQACSHNIKACP